MPSSRRLHLVYEPLLFVAFIYVCLTGLLVAFFRWLENRVPSESMK